VGGNSRTRIDGAYNFGVTDRFLFQLGFAALLLGVAMIAVPWLGIASAVVMLVASLLAYWRLRRVSPPDPSHAPAGQRV
jgi:membrane protein implicated in regulation of membrane protease activity